MTAPQARLNQLAAAMRRVFLVLVDAGFTEDQALRFLAYSRTELNEEQI